jgi:small basic protein
MDRINHKAAIVAGILYYGIQSAWYTVFGKAWLAALGKTLPEILAEMNGKPYWPLYVTAFVCDLILAYVLAYVVLRAGARGAAAGIKVALVLGLGIVGPVTLTNYFFEMHGAMLVVIDAGCVIFGLVVMGAILGGWQRKLGELKSG